MGAQVREILQRKKYAYLWAKYSLEDKQDPVKRAVFKQKLEALLLSTKADPRDLQVWCAGRNGLQFKSNSPGCVGVKRVSVKRLPDSDGKGESMLWVDCARHHRKRLCFFVEKGNADNS